MFFNYFKVFNKWGLNLNLFFPPFNVYPTENPIPAPNIDGSTIDLYLDELKWFVEFLSIDANGATITAENSDAQPMEIGINT